MSDLRMSDLQEEVSGQPWRGFASDNYAGVHPQILAALTRVNSGHQVAYGDDSITAELDERMATLFGRPVGIYPVFNGTGANIVALSSIMNQWEAVVCTNTSHLHMDEGGAPEKVAGIKLWTVPGVNGKLTPDLIPSAAQNFGSVHYAQAGAVSIAQSTEMGDGIHGRGSHGNQRVRPRARPSSSHGRRADCQCRGVPWCSHCPTSPSTLAWTSCLLGAPKTDADGRSNCGV